LDGLPASIRALVLGDIALVTQHGRLAPVSVKAIKGPKNRGLLEIRTGGYRTFYCVVGGVMWVLHGCKKQDQAAGISVARERMKQVR
jgi:phage-related protein